MSSPLPIISKPYRLYLGLSAGVMVLGIVITSVLGLRLGVDFSGGTIVEFQAKKGDVDLNGTVLQAKLPPGVEVVDFSTRGVDQYTLRLSPLRDDQRAALTASLSGALHGYTEESLFTVGPSIGQELVTKTVIAIVLSALCIVLYLAARFRSLPYGVSAVIAVLHDMVVVVAAFSLLGYFLRVEIDTLFVTALLTVVSFSVHDTVVVYDRIRERRKKVFREDIGETIDRAVLETLIRSLRNSLAVVIVLVALFVLGGETLKWFVLALLIGMISGTYSSVFVALPILLFFQRKVGGR